MKHRYLLVIILIFSLPWLINAYKLSQCDFESNLKCEIIHGAGLIAPPLSYITVWFETDVK